MSQPLLKDPIVSSSIVRTGTGTGTVSIDKLTHFTTAQTYTLICIAKSPDTIFSVSGSLDGPVGLATVGTQFFDADLKIFLTLQQGGTVFEVGDKFVFSVANGTDLDQDNIDLFDELTQKNFGVGVKGTLAGDQNLRYSDVAQAAYALLQGLKFVAAATGSGGNALQVQTQAPVAVVPAVASLQQLAFTSAQTASAGNGVTVTLTPAVPAIKAQTTIQNVNYQAKTAGAAGNAFTIAYTTGGTPGSEVITRTGNAVTVQIASGSSTPAQIVASFNASSLVNSDLVAKVTPIGNTTAQTAPVSAQSLTGGANGIALAGSEIVTVSGNAITVQCENNASTYTQVKAALDAYPAAHALVNTAITGTPSNTVTSGAGPATLSGGTDAYGYVGSEKVTVSGNLISLFLESGRSTETSVLAAFNVASAATALASASIVGNGTDVMYSPGSVVQFKGGLSRFFAFNQHELTDTADFAEGNGSVRAQDLVAAGRAAIAGPVELADKLSLEDTSAEAGPRVPHAQRYINRLITLGKLSIRTSDASPVRYYNGQLLFSSDLLITQRDTSVTGTLPASSLSPISIPDGQSVYVVLNPTTSGNLVPIVASSVDKGVFVLRLCTRVGSRLFWFNGVSMGDNDVARAGSQSDYGAQVRGIITGGGTLSSDQTTIGLLTWSAPLFLRMFGQTGAVQVAAGSVTLADGQAAYLQLDDPFTTATKTFVVDTATVDDLRRQDRYWVFYRNGNIVYTRNGGDLVPGEENSLGNEISADVFQFIGSQSEVDNAPSYSTAGHTTSATSNSYVTDADSLTKSIKNLDTRLGIESGIEQQDRDIVLVGGGLWNFPSSGNVNFSADAFLSVPGLPNARNKLAAATFGLLDGQCAYAEINRSGTSAASLTISVAAIDTFSADDNRVIFARRVGGIVTLRDGTTLVVGETKAIGAGLSTSTLSLLGILSETDAAPNPVYSTSTANRYIGDTDALPASIKKLDTRLGAVSDLEWQDRSAYFVEGGNWSWTLSTGVLAWDADAFVSIAGLLNARNRIPTGNVTLADGNVAYVSVNRTGTSAATLTVSIAATIDALTLTDNVKILARRIGQHVIVAQGMLLQDGQSLPLGSGGSGGGGVAVVRGLDSVDTTLPTTTATTIDGLTVANADQFLFTNLATGNNEIYKATVSGTAITWTLQKLGQNPTGAPTGGDMTIVRSGTVYADRLFEYSLAATAWVDYLLHKNLDNLTSTTAVQNGVIVQPANDKLADLGQDTKRWGNVFSDKETTNSQRIGAGVRFVEETYFDGATLTGGGTTIFSNLSFDTTIYKAMHVDYVIYDSTSGVRRTGTLYIVADAPAGSASSSATVSDAGGYTGDVGVDWTAAMSGNIAQVSYTATTGNKTMHATVKKFLG